MRVMQTFFDEPAKDHYLLEISRNAKLAHTSTKKHLTTLKKQGMITESKEKKATRIFPVFSASINNPEYTKIKRMFNLLNLEQSGLIDRIQSALMPRSIVLFGSYSRGEDIEDSDIDIFVEGNIREINLKTYEKKLCRKIELHFRKEFGGLPEELKNNIANGIVLRGYLEVYETEGAEGSREGKIAGKARAGNTG